jgi:uncharacterized BrkB/YihY/UPF0761 family membrane protein
MGRNNTAKIVCCAIGCLITYNILMALLPFIEMILAFIGAVYLYHEYQKGKRR